MRLLRQCALLSLASWATAKVNATESSNTVPALVTPPKHFRNVNLVRNVNLEKSYPHETINVVVENIDAAPQLEYFLAFERDTISRVGGLDVKNKKEPEQQGFVVDLVGDALSSHNGYYRITFPTALAPQEQITLSINYYLLSALTPLPAQIEQNDKQYVLHKFSAYAPSAYATLKQKTKLKLPTTDVPDYVTLPESLNAEGKQDPQKQGSSFTYGPYSEIAAGTAQEVSVRYEFTKPLLHSRVLERDIEVSHWGGNIATEERHWFTNRAATLKSQFSRLAYQQSSYFNPPTSALKELRYPLTVGSQDAYFTDDIGNVSTSRFRSNLREALLELKPRYPLYGGWNYNFRVGWNANLGRFLRNVKGSADTYVLKVPFFEGPKQAEGLEYERIITRVILPEGALNVKFETTVPIVSVETTAYRTFFDTIGRTALILTATNIVDEFRDRDLIVTYEYPSVAKFRKPLTITATVLFVFVISWIVGNLDVSIGKKKKA